MRKHLIPLFALSIVLCGTATVSFAAKTPNKPVPKTPAKPVVKPTTASVQLPGGPGAFGTVYKLGEQCPMYFRLVKAEYTTDQVVIGEKLIAPTGNEKLLVLHFTIQNPNKSEEYVCWESLRFTAIDKNNQNHDGGEDWGNEVDGKSFAMTMKPAQTAGVFTVVHVPAKGIMPKLMVLPPGENDGPVLRFDLTDPKNKVQPLKAPFADPADVSGYTALENIAGTVGRSYPYMNFDVTVEKFEYTTDQLGEETIEDESRYLVATLLMKNESPIEEYVCWNGTINPVLKSTEGEELTYKDMLLANANRPFAQNVKGKSEVRVRIYFSVPKDITAKTLSLNEGESRTYQFEVKQGVGVSE